MRTARMATIRMIWTVMSMMMAIMRLGNRAHGTSRTTASPVTTSVMLGLPPSPARRLFAARAVAFRPQASPLSPSRPRLSSIGQ